MVYWVRTLDSSNIANAYVSGMKEDINMQGNDYINTVTVFNVANNVFQIPFMYFLPRFPIHIILPAMDIGWGIFTLASFRVNSTRDIQIMRFFVGAFESSFYTTVHYLFGSWYLPAELGRRGAIHYFGQMIGTMSSGLLQAAIHRSLDGTAGLPGWRWMFIINAIITIPVGLIGFMLIPGTPYKCYSVFLSDEEIRIARARLKKNNIVPPQKEIGKFWDKKRWTKILTSWQLWVLTFYYTCCFNSSNHPGNGYALWLKSLNRFDTSKLNNLTTISPGVGIVLIAMCSLIADLGRCRYGGICFTQILNFTGNLLLTLWNIPEHSKWFAFSIQYAGWAQAATMCAWINDILRHDPQDRAIIWLTLFAVSQSTVIWIVRLIWPTVDAPRFLVGYATTMAWAAVLFLFSFVVLWFYKNDEKKYALDNGIYLYNSSKGETIPEDSNDSESNKEKLSEKQSIQELIPIKN
ncbi:MFS general substrate transporter [Ascoidea rubescens DSM 1968]|uniref:MFS general substrate transporter n=1 Tax=Ascoidea rubescens DSM 1968 TaxID=1344418 RepID=A0A1D2VRH0_9ASCO|nr:MFS general substrate transporter [Ascoidea rubescens DSM 1968]ODV64167.1 MFS general substrate transporter [Ascoidea rubescens DSM 1968]